MKFSFSFIFFLFSFCKIFYAQSLGGNAVFTFATQPNTAQLSALGGINISNITNDIGMSFQNPALLRNQMHNQLNTSFNSFFAGIKNYSLTTGWHLNKTETNIAVGINYFNYGSATQTDASGNVLGSFKPNDYVVQLQASRKYLERWWYGATIKFLSSNYAQYKSNGIAADVAVAYYDSTNQFQASFVVKNIGTQLKTYDGTTKQELPFDMQIGFTKRLAKAPIQFSVTVHHLQTFNIHYNDTTFAASEGNSDYNNSNTAKKILSHFVLGAQLFITSKIEATVGYNFLRRNDLNVYNSTNGLNGFTMGAGVLLKKLHIRYATGFYQQNMFHQFSLNLNWKGSEL